MMDRENRLLRNIGKTTSQRNAMLASRDDPYAGMSTIDALRMSQEIANNADPSPMQRMSNKAQTVRDVLGVTPVIGNAMSAQDTYSSAVDASDALRRGDYRQAGVNALMAGVSGVGTVTGLPFGKTAARVAREAPDTMRIFAGANAKTADLDALSRAQQMQKAGATADDIWRETGWFNQHGSWKYEIDDSASGVNLPDDNVSGVWSNYSTAIDHPKAFSAYPDMGSNRIRFDPRSPDSGIITRPSPNSLDQKFDTDIGMQVNNVRSSALHEMQHNVQNREGFEPGASPTYFYIMGNTPLSVEESTNVMRLNKMMERTPKGSPEYKDLFSRREDILMESAYREYTRMAGEVEARNVQTRMNMSPERRRAMPPWTTQDVPDEDQIFRSR